MSKIWNIHSGALKNLPGERTESQIYSQNTKTLQKTRSLLFDEIEGPKEASAPLHLLKCATEYTLRMIIR